MRPSKNSPCNPSLALSACSKVAISTNPKLRDSLVCGSTIIWHLRTSPYFEKRRVMSSSVKRGWIPITNKFVPGFSLFPEALCPLGVYSRVSPRVSDGALLRKGNQSRIVWIGVCCPYRSSSRRAPAGEMLRFLRGESPRRGAPRGEAERSSRRNSVLSEGGLLVVVWSGESLDAVPNSPVSRPPSKSMLAIM